MTPLETTGVVYNPLADKWSLSRDTGVKLHGECRAPPQ